MEISIILIINHAESQDTVIEGMEMYKRLNISVLPSLIRRRQAEVYIFRNQRPANGSRNKKQDLNRIQHTFPQYFTILHPVQALNFNPSSSFSSFPSSPSSCKLLKHSEHVSPSLGLSGTATRGLGMMIMGAPAGIASEA